MRNDSRGQRTEMNPVDETSNVPKKELETPIDTVKAETKPNTVSGVVVNCLKLNVRKEPKIDADVVTRISALTEVVIDTGASAGDFYKVCTDTGIEGFCMKKYIALK